MYHNINNQTFQPDSTSFVEAQEKYPDVALEVIYTYDEFYQWDGDCDEPESPAYVIEVKASKIVEGKLVCASSYLGGCYPEEDDELDFEIGGYAPQMIQEAIEELLAN